MRPVILVLLLALAGCAAVDTKPVVHTAAYAPAFVQAQTLAAGHAAVSGQARRDNTDAIERLLAQLDDSTLARDAAKLPAGDALYNFAGRVLLRRGLPLPHPFDRGDTSFGAAHRPAADTDGYRPPLKVAILLPLSGSQAAAAEAVRDGYLAGYYSESRRRPTLRFYDSSAGVKSALSRAASDGNDFAVGPLGRDEADAVFAEEPPLPLLALNRGNRSPSAGSAAFSLSPEDEGISLAQALIERGSKHVLLVAGSEEAQRRTVDSAKAQLERRGVQVVASLGYSAQMTDALAQLAQTHLPDTLLLVLKAPQARSLIPQLTLANLGQVPRYASSQITSGTGKAVDDMVLDGTIFPTEPWLIRPVQGLPSQASAAARVNTAKGPAARLFAFGVDAWRLTAYLERLALQPNTRIQGATGQLSLDGFGNVLRRPAWSRFSGGIAVPLADGAR